MTVKELIDKLQQFDEDKLVLVEDTEYNKLVLVEDTEYKEFQAIDVERVDDRFIIITTTMEPLRVLRTLRYTPRRGWNGSCASNISIVINNNDYID